MSADSAGITFEYKGDGSTQYASVMVGQDDHLFNAYEAIFPLNGAAWQTMTLCWKDFVKNDLPWGTPPPKLSLNEVSPTPAKLKFIGFGRGVCFFKFYTQKFSFAIRNIRVMLPPPAAPMPSFSQGLTRTKSLLQQHKPLNILLLGDSITDFGGDKSYGYHCARLIEQKWPVKCTVINAGIAGHSVRAGTIVLPRSMGMMPHPDLVCIMYGANDCKAMGGKSGFGQDVFARNLEDLIDQVRRQTGGQSDIVLLSGVPRLDKPGGNTTGVIEKIVGAYAKVAEKKQTAFCNTFPAYLALPPDKKKTYYRDTVHQTQPGLEFLGQLLFQTIASDSTP